MDLCAVEVNVITGDRTIHLKTIHLTHFCLETGYCHGRVMVMVRVRVRVSVWARVMIGVTME